MLKALFAILSLICAFHSNPLSANCCCSHSADVSFGWRRDALEWSAKDLHSSYVSACADSKINFKNINSYMMNGEAKWAGSAYYIRLSGDYAASFKGRAHEDFNICSPLLRYPIHVCVSDPVQPRTHLYDVNAAVGYPLSFYCCRLCIVPLVGFSFHRQDLSVREDCHCPSSCCDSSSYCSCYSNSYSHHSSSDSYSRRSSHSRRSSSHHHSSHSHRHSNSHFPPLSSYFSTRCNKPGTTCSSSCSCSSSSHFRVNSCSNPFKDSFSYDPFGSSSSDSGIASALGLINRHRTSHYRFSWYGFYIGTDLSYALDCDWTLFSELEYHFLDNCHRKRKSWTGVNFVDDYHHKNWAHGFDALVGINYVVGACWYATFTVDFKWWESDSHHDRLKWKTVNAKAGIGYVF